MFFNVPSVLTADLWGKWSSAFFYQFDHVSDSQSSGKIFLKPLPLVSKGESKGLTAHGDELGFLFDVYDVFGNKINGTSLTSSRDKQARKNFMDVVVKFAYMNSSHSELNIDDLVFKPFQADASHFIKVSDKISSEKDFRFCQLSMLGTPLKASQKISCEFLSQGLKSLPLPLPLPSNPLSGVIGRKKFGFV